MNLSTGRSRAMPTASDYDFDAERLPIRQTLCRFEVGDLPAADDETAIFHSDLLRPAAVVGIDLEERSQSGNILNIRDRHRNEKAPLEGNFHQGTSDSTKPMNCYISHCVSTFL